MGDQLPAFKDTTLPQHALVERAFDFAVQKIIQFHEGLTTKIKEAIPDTEKTLLEASPEDAAKIEAHLMAIRATVTQNEGSIQETLAKYLESWEEKTEHLKMHATNPAPELYAAAILSTLQGVFASDDTTIITAASGDDEMPVMQNIRLLSPYMDLVAGFSDNVETLRIVLECSDLGQMEGLDIDDILKAHAFHDQTYILYAQERIMALAAHLETYQRWQQLKAGTVEPETAIDAALQAVDAFDKPNENSAQRHCRLAAHISAIDEKIALGLMNNFNLLAATAETGLAIRLTNAGDFVTDIPEKPSVSRQFEQNGHTTNVAQVSPSRPNALGNGKGFAH